MAANYEYWLSKKDDQYWFHLRENGNREIILASTEGYKTEQGCKNGIESTRKNSPFDENYVRKQATNGKYYFVLRAGNYEPINKSELYETAAGRDKGIENCKKEGPTGGTRRLEDR